MTERAGKTREQLLNQGSSYKRTGAEMKGNGKVKQLKFALVEEDWGTTKKTSNNRKDTRFKVTSLKDCSTWKQALVKANTCLVTTYVLLQLSSKYF